MSVATAKVVAASINMFEKEIVTYQVTAPRYILAEFNTHRVFSRNSASSRAIPFVRMVKALEANPYIPFVWMKDHKGMQGTDFIEDEDMIKLRVGQWERARMSAIACATELHSEIKATRDVSVTSENGGIVLQKEDIPDGEEVTKQTCNRLLEPFMYHTILVTSTEWDNFFNLRCPKYQAQCIDEELYFKSKKQYIEWWSSRIWNELDLGLAVVHPDPTQWSTLDWAKINRGKGDFSIMSLAEAMYDVYNETKFVPLQPGEWHIPFGDSMNEQEITRIVLAANPQLNIPAELTTLGYNTMSSVKRKIAVARAARLSYQTLGVDPKVDYKADLDLYEYLYADKHMSPFEHIAKSMTEDEWFKCQRAFMVDKEIVIRYGWLNNFQGYIQERAYIEF